MSRFAVTLRNGSVIEVNAPDSESAMAHAREVAESHKKPVYVGPKNAGQGMPDQLHRDADHGRANDEQPVSAERVK